MRDISPETYKQLRLNAEILEQDGYGEKVLRLTDGSFIKLFRSKRALSSNFFKPYAVRFAQNCEGLAERGVPCPNIIDCFRITQPSRDVVHYRPLLGDSLRDLFQQERLTQEDRKQLIAFVKELHDKGIYFRSLHFGNIIKTQEGSLGLIDVADLKFQKKPLSHWQRKRNLAHLMREEKEWAWIQEAGTPRLDGIA